MGDLFATEAVYVQHNAVKKLLRKHYNGPYEVIAQGSKYFKIKGPIGKVHLVLIDQLKLFILEDTTKQPLGGHFKKCSNNQETIPVPREETPALPSVLPVTSPTSPVPAVLLMKKKKTLKTYAEAIAKQPHTTNFVF